MRSAAICLAEPPVSMTAAASSSAICGSDLHLLDGYVPTMQDGDVMGHEFMGEVIETGPDVPADRLRAGDRVVVPFPIACGACCRVRGRAVLLL